MGEMKTIKNIYKEFSILALLVIFSYLIFSLPLNAQELDLDARAQALTAPSVIQDINVEFDRAVDNDPSNTRSLILSNAYKEHFLSPYLTVYKDKLNNLSAKHIIRSTNITGILSQNSGSIIHLRTDGIPTWLSFDTMNRSSQTQWKVDFGSSFMGRFGLFEDAEAYVFNKEARTLQKRVLQKDGSIYFDLPIDQKSQIIIKIDSTAGVPTTVPLRLLHQEQELSTQNNLLFVISITLLIGMAFFFAAIALLRSHLFYLYFSLLYGLFGALLIAQNYLFVSVIPIVGGYLIPLIIFAIALSGLMMARIFWNLHEKPKVVDILFIGLIVICCAAFLAGLFLPISAPSLKNVLLFGPSLIIIIVITSISMIPSQRGNSEVTAFMLGWSILMFGVFITMLALSDIVPPVSTAINAFWFTLIPQAFFFAMAVKIKFGAEFDNITMSRTLEINESESVSKLRKSKENTEQDRLLKVIEQERKVLGELRKSEARRTEEMSIAKDEADNANSAKSAFLAVVSHEIRTPMTGIMGMVKLLMNSNLTKEQKEFATTIQDSSDAMLALLNDILDFEKIEQGKMTLENISFDLHRLIQGVATLMNGHATQKNIDLRVKIGDNLPKYVKGDPTRLRQVLLNLTGNSVKFTSEGHVTITAELMDESTGSGDSKIYLGISDSGVGISKEAQEKLFTPFSQADSSVSRKFGGTGLGLAISKGLVESMGSTINISSNLGEGSTFFFTLDMPIGQGDSSADKVTAQQSVKAKPMDILVVEDNKINQKVVAGFLEKSPYKLTMADNGNEALQKIENNSYDMVLMDIELPDMSGDEVTKKIRSSNNEKIKNLPVIALTGNMMPQDIERFYAAGMNGALAKPIDIDMLISTIKKSGEGVFDNPHFSTSQQQETPKKEVTQNPVAAPKPEVINTPTPTQPKTLDVQEAREVEEKVEKLSPPPMELPTELDAGDLQVEGEGPADNTNIFDHAVLDALKDHISEADIKEMLDDVIVKTEEIIKGMNDALVQNKNEELAARGHELRGMAGNFGLTELAEHAGTIEKKSKTEASIVLAGLLDPLPEMQKRAQGALNNWLNSN